MPVRRVTANSESAMAEEAETQATDSEEAQRQALCKSQRTRVLVPVTVALPVLRMARQHAQDAMRHVEPGLPAVAGYAACHGVAFLQFSFSCCLAHLYRALLHAHHLCTGVCGAPCARVQYWHWSK